MGWVEGLPFPHPFFIRLEAIVLKEQEFSAAERRNRTKIETLLKDLTNNNKDLVKKYMAEVDYCTTRDRDRWIYFYILETLQDVYRGDNAQVFSSDIGIMYPLKQRYYDVVEQHRASKATQKEIEEYIKVQGAENVAKKIAKDTPDVLISISKEVLEEKNAKDYEDIMSRLYGPRIDIDKMLDDFEKEGELNYETQGN